MRPAGRRIGALISPPSRPRDQGMDRQPCLSYPSIEEARMKFRRLCLIAIFILPATLPAASREMQELQRDVAQLQQDLKTLQRAFDEKVALLTAQTLQSLELNRDTNKTLLSLDGRLQEQFRQQSKEVVAPIASYGAKIDQLSSDFSQVRESMADVTTRMSKLEQQIA